MENMALKLALLKEWECNHAEHCHTDVPPVSHKNCCWPMPKVLHEEMTPDKAYELLINKDD